MKHALIYTTSKRRFARRIWRFQSFSTFDRERFKVHRHTVGDIEKREQQVKEVKELQKQVQELYQRGKFNDAKVAAEECLQLVEGSFGKENPAYASAANNLGLLCKELGDYNESIENYTAALQTYKETFGDFHPSTGTTMYNLGRTYKALADMKIGMERHQMYLVAKELFQDALKNRKRNLGEQHPETGATMQAFSAVLFQLGDKKLAAENVLEGAKIIERALGNKDPRSATAWNNVGFYYKCSGQFGEALDWYNRALELNRSLYGDSHLQTITIKHNLAELYHKIEDTESSNRLREEILRDVKYE